MEQPVKQKMAWYHKPVTVVIAILAFGPLALPLVWASPAFKTWAKIVLTIFLIAFTIWIGKISIDIYRSLMKQMQDLQNAIR